MKLYLYLLLIPILNYFLIFYLVSFLLILFLIKILLSKSNNPKKLNKTRKIHVTILVPIFNEARNLKNLIDWNEQEEVIATYIKQIRANGASNRPSLRSKTKARKKYR